MNCYLCDQAPPVGALRYGIQSAVGVNSCEDHPGSPG